jgi:hypothetical protein
MPVTNEEIDAEVLAAVLRFKPGWLPDDDAFCPTEYWSDCGPLIDLFDIDVGPHNGQWMAYCRLDMGKNAVAENAKLAICQAVLRMTHN